MSEPLRVQFGAGGNTLEGWKNHDADVDVTKPLPYADDAVDIALCEHCCEHVPTPDFFRFLLECRRILKPGGSLYLAMPVIDRLPPDHARDIILGHGHIAAYTIGSLEAIVRLSGFSYYVWNAYRHEFFGHWKVIGEPKDALETHRILCVK